MEYAFCHVHVGLPESAEHKRASGSKLTPIMTHSTLWLSQIQFFSSLGFMLLFLALELGLAWILLYFKVRALRTGSAAWTQAYRFWIRVFALAFVLSFGASMPVLIQLGSLWPSLMEHIGEVAGPLLAAAILTTFIFKSCFLGAMLFGQRRLVPAAYATVVAMVAIGVTLSTFLLVALLSWMHTPQGAVLVDGRYQVQDWIQVVFSPALPWYFLLFLLGSGLTAAFLMLGIVAAQTFRRPADESERHVFKTALFVACVAVILQAVAAAGAVLMSAQYQPARAAAVFAYWHSGTQVDLPLFSWSEASPGARQDALSRQAGSAPWLGRNADGVFRGLDEFSGMSPPVGLTFWSFRASVIVGGLMAVVSGLVFWRTRRAGFDPGALSAVSRRVLVGMTFSGWAMLLSGLCYILFGLFPYAVNGTVTVSQIASETSGRMLWGGLIAHIVVYGVLLAGFLQLLRHVAHYGVVPVARRRGRA